MVGSYGMGEQLDAFYNKNIDPMLARNGDTYSDSIKEMIDQESLDLVDEALFRAQKILSENREQLDVLVDKLLEKTVLYEADFDCSTKEK
jgi:ATP-dependent Zn protease